MADLTDWDDDIPGDDAMDDTIIELTDIADKGLDDTIEEEIIELTDIVEDDSHDLNLDIVREESSEVEEDIVNEGLELEIDTDVTEIPGNDEPALVPAGNLSLRPEQLEAALERVVEKKFADKIETILFEVLERVIEKEINEIKASLQKDLDQLGTV